MIEKVKKDTIELTNFQNFGNSLYNIVGFEQASRFHSHLIAPSSIEMTIVLLFILFLVAAAAPVIIAVHIVSPVTDVGVSVEEKTPWT
jgi:hypothetical protein